MRPSFLLPLFVGASCFASAVDSLTVKKVIRYHQSIVNSATIGAWDSTVVDVSDPANWLLLGTPSLAPYEQLFVDFPRSVTHPRVIRFDSAGTDMVRWVSVRDSSVVDPTTPGSYLPRRFLDSSITTPVITRSNNSYYTPPTGQVHLSVLWAATNVLSVGKIVGDSIFQAWSGSFLGMNIPHDQYTGWSLPNAVNLLTLTQPSVIRYYSESNASQILGALSVSSVGQGTIDTTRAELLLYHYIFQLGDGSAGVRPRGDHAQGIRALSTATGFDIRLGAVGAVRIVSPDGKVARTFAPASSVAWDGTDASGRKLTGLWIVNAAGQGSLPILLK